MGFKQLLAKVQQAEAALEARERGAAAGWQHLKATWRAAWTPGRVIVAGLAAGFVAGRARPLRMVAGSGQFMQLATLLSGLFAGTTAQAAAEEAEHAADSADEAAEAVAPGTVASAGATAQAAAPPASHAGT